MTGAIATAVGAAVAGSVFSSILAPDSGGSSIPKPSTPPPAPQASQAPDAQGVRSSVGGSGQAGGAPGAANTLLTGGGGVDPTKLLMGKNTLLGG